MDLQSLTAARMSSLPVASPEGNQAALDFAAIAAQVEQPGWYPIGELTKATETSKRRRFVVLDGEPCSIHALRAALKVERVPENYEITTNGDTCYLHVRKLLESGIPSE